MNLGIAHNVAVPSSQPLKKPFKLVKAMLGRLLLVAVEHSVNHKRNGRRPVENTDGQLTARRSSGGGERFAAAVQGGAASSPFRREGHEEAGRAIGLDVRC